MKTALFLFETLAFSATNSERARKKLPKYYEKLFDAPQILLKAISRGLLHLIRHMSVDV